ncbi:MAG: SIS domain-containing protein, partial [Alphaproteobacteria bacterium]|nr:SIS domain-containing protein [Alphaproteobacteria bacterium]
FIKALHLIEKAQKTGKVIVSGMGKSAHIGKKLATTMSSTGTPSIFVHPGEASHGDLGSITTKDIVIAFSNSGESKELFDLYDYCDKFKIPYIGITRNTKGSLAKRATVSLVLPDIPEVCAIGKAPTTSTIMQAAMGDALTVVASQRIGLTKEAYKNWHPGGKLGGSLTYVKNFLKKKNLYHLVQKTDSIEKIKKLYAKQDAPLIVVDKNIFQGTLSPTSLLNTIKDFEKEICNKNIFIDELSPVFDLAPLFKKYDTKFIVVVDKNKKVKGIVYGHDLLQS